VKGLSGQLLGGQLAPVGGNACWPGLDGALLLPFLKGAGIFLVLWILDPLDDLCHGHKVDVIVSLKSLIKPVEESVQEFWVVLQPCSMEEETKRSTVLIVMTVEVVGQEVVELVTADDVVAGINHGTAWQCLVKLGIGTPVQLVHHHLPNGM